MTLGEELSSEEKSAIKELKTRTKSFLTPKLREDTSVYYRFLKARDFDVDKAEKMLMKHITWRKVHQVDNILDDWKPKEVFFKYAFPSVIGLDKDGGMVIYSPSGKIETSDILKCEKLNDYKKDWIWFCEKNSALLKEHSQKTGKECNQTTYIIDLDKLSLSNVTNKSTTDIWLKITHLFQDNYPERMRRAFVINAPGYYVFVYSVLKSVMSGAMVQKINVFGQNGWKEKLLDIIDADVLPAFLGGNRTDPDGNPLCHTVVNHISKVSPEYYLSHEDRYFKDTSQVKRITIPHKSKKEICVDVTEKECIINCEYLVKSKDIGFGLFFQKSEQSTKEEVIPVERYSTVDGTELGSFKCRSVGKYIIIFDNSHSWMNSKEIEYCLTVIKSQ